MAGAATDWRAAGVSVAGAGHVRAGAPCQDAHQVEHFPGGLLVAAVADGAGSAPRAEVGAGCAVKAAVGAVAGRLAGGLPPDDEGWRRLLGEALRAARDVVFAEAAGRGCAPSDLSTTLLVAVATPDLVAAGQVGDGAVVARLAGDDFRAVTRPPEQEYVNETTFLTSPDPAAAAQLAVLRAGPTGLALFSDGLQMLALQMPGGTPHPPFFTPLFRFVAQTRDRPTAEDQLRRFLQSPRITERADDDLTLVLAVRAAG